MGELVFQEDRILVCYDEKVLEIHGGNGCT